MKVILLFFAAGFAVLGAASDAKNFQIYESDAGFLSEQVNNLAFNKDGRGNCTKFTTTVGQGGKKAFLNPLIVASKRINVVLTEFTSAVFTVQVQVGAGANLTGSEPKEMRLMLDTRNHMTVLLGENCSTCNNSNKYIAHENATVLDDL